MKLYIKQKVFSIGDKFRVYDENGNDCYSVKGEIFSFGRKFHLYSNGGTELSFISQKLLTFLPKYSIECQGFPQVELKRKLTFFAPEYSIDELGWAIKGDFFSHEYSIYCNGRTVGYVSKKWLSWGDTYEIYIAEEREALLILSAVIAIDGVVASQSNN